MGRLVATTWGTTTLGDCAAIAGSLARPSQLAEGPEIERYERDFAQRIGVRHAVAFATGRLALYAILKALGEFIDQAGAVGSYSGDQQLCGHQVLQSQD